ncbi:hypothetical protein [Streptomyces antimycoticus]|nr:hypothetical protein [Streptomyces antimycoticus]
MSNTEKPLPKREKGATKPPDVGPRPPCPPPAGPVFRAFIGQLSEVRW